MSPDLDLSAAEQAEEQQEWDGGPVDHNGEVVEIEGKWNGCLDAGVCWGELDEHPQDPGDSGGGGGGGGGGGDKPPYEPVRKDCMKEEDREACMQCCDYNADKVDHRYCDKKWRGKTNKEQRARCHKDADKTRFACYEECPKLIIYETIVGPQ